MRYLQFIFIILFTGTFALAQSDKESEIHLAYYNLDKLFDTNDDPYDIDDDYTSTGKFFWGEDRYEKKKDALIEKIKSITPGTFPEILLLTGFEKNRVIDDLLSDRVFRKSAYKKYFAPKELRAVILSEESIIDNVRFKELELNNDPEIEKYIQYAEIEFSNGNIIHLFINNWPEIKANIESGRQRINCAVALRKEIDNILNFERDARIILAGTFFDEPTSRSIMSMLNATNKRKNLDYRDLYNPFYDMHNNNEIGTYEVNGRMQMFDFIIVSTGLLRNNEGYKTSFGQAVIINNTNSTPTPTFRGEDFIGGAGSHFPVMINLSNNN